MLTQTTVDTNTAQPLTPAERDTWNSDFADGRRKFWQGYSLCYCANGGERAGYWAAASEDALEQRIARDEQDAVRESLMGAW